MGLTYGLGGAEGLIAAGRFYDLRGGRMVYQASAGVALAGASTGALASTGSDDRFRRGTGLSGLE